MKVATSESVAGPGPEVGSSWTGPGGPGGAGPTSSPWSSGARDPTVAPHPLLGSMAATPGPDAGAQVATAATPVPATAVAPSGLVQGDTAATIPAKDSTTGAGAGAAAGAMYNIQSMDWLFKKERIFLLAQFWQQVSATFCSPITTTTTPAPVNHLYYFHLLHKPPSHVGPVQPTPPT